MEKNAYCENYQELPCGYIVMVSPGVYLQELELESFECTAYWREAHLFNSEEIAISAANHVDSISEYNGREYKSSVYMICHCKVASGLYKED